MKNLAKKTILGAFLAAAVTFAMAGGDHTSARNNASVGASGQGSLPAVNESGDTRKRQFSFSAHRQDNGTVKGNAVLHNPTFTTANGQKYQLQIDISCMKVIGNTIFFGGLTKRTNDPNLVDAAYFSVQDNGEPGKGTDKISRVFFFDDDPNTTGDPQLCQGNVIGDFPMETIESGNINVRSDN
jgi:ribosomal protein L28